LTGPGTRAIVGRVKALLVLALTAAVAAPTGAASPSRVETALELRSGPQAGACYLVEQSVAANETGGIVRALVETFARESAILYGFLQQVYDSAFISTGGEDLAATLTLVDVAATPAVLAQADLSIHDPGVGKLVVESAVRGEDHQQLPQLGACVRVRLHGGARFDRD
jgi:hypothetical protein